MKVRIKFRKYGVMKFIGHLDMMRYFQKAMRRGDIPIAFTGGYSPHMVMSFANPLGVGLTSDSEYFDIELEERVSSREAVKRLNQVMVEGVEIVSFRELADTQKTGMSIVAAAKYRSVPVVGTWVDGWEKMADTFLSQEQITIVKKTKKSEKEVDIKP
ncbi:MAG: TIGR03936 family radical SAM-associated protein, partial [Lachnospiraceae bacterium]